MGRFCDSSGRGGRGATKLCKIAGTRNGFESTQTRADTVVVSDAIIRRYVG